MSVRTRVAGETRYLYKTGTRSQSSKSEGLSWTPKVVKPRVVRVRGVGPRFSVLTGGMVYRRPFVGAYLPESTGPASHLVSPYSVRSRLDSRTLRSVHVDHAPPEGGPHSFHPRCRRRTRVFVGRGPLRPGPLDRFRRPRRGRKKGEC